MENRKNEDQVERPTPKGTWVRHDIAGGIGIAGIVKDSHVDENGNTVINDVELTGVSLVSHTTDPNTKILRIKGESNGQES